MVDVKYMNVNKLVDELEMIEFFFVHDQGKSRVDTSVISSRISHHRMQSPREEECWFLHALSTMV